MNMIDIEQFRTAKGNIEKKRILFEMAEEYIVSNPGKTLNYIALRMSIATFWTNRKCREILHQVCIKNNLRIEEDRIIANDEKQ